VFWLICDDMSPGVISYEATYQYCPSTHDSPGVISFESIRILDQNENTLAKIIIPTDDLDEALHYAINDLKTHAHRYLESFEARLSPFGFLC